MFDFLLVEGVVLLIIATTIIRNIFTIPKRQIPFFVALIPATTLAYFLVARNLFGFYDLIADYVDVGPLYEKLGALFLTPRMKGFYLFLLFAATAAILFAVFYYLTTLILKPKLKLYKTDPEYTLSFHPWTGAIIGIVEAAFFVLIYLTLLNLILPATGMTLTNSWLYENFVEYDVIAEQFRNFASEHVGAPF